MGAGGYELAARIGGGGMADVFLARRRGAYAIEHTVVVKRLRDDLRGSPAVVKMFAWEAWLSARLCHPNIVKFYDFVTHKGRDHLVLEHVRGSDLATIGRALSCSGRSFPFRCVVEVGVAASRALAHVHGLEDDEGVPIGLVHRDVSPQNILVSTEGEIKLIDFGVAKTTSAHVPRDTAPGLVKGKLGYIAPEHLRGQPLDARGDVYALGVVLFEMLAGKPLLRRGADTDMIRAALESDIPPLSALRPDCPPALEALVRRALAREPCDRFESAAAMERALREVGDELDEERGAQTLSELSREVYASRTDDRSRLSAQPPSGPRSERSSAGRAKKDEGVRAEEDTRPEGALRRARSHRDPEDTTAASSAPSDATRPEGIVQRAEASPAMSSASLVRANTPRLLPIVLAFVMGALLAAAARIERSPARITPANDAPPRSEPARQSAGAPVADR